MTQRHGAGAWTGRLDAIDGDAGRRWHRWSNRPCRRIAGVALVGFACDAGVRRNLGRPAPRRVRWNSGGCSRTSAWYGGDAPAIRRRRRALRRRRARAGAAGRYAAQVASLLRDGHRPIGLGGGHEIAWGTYQGIASRAGDPRLERLGIVNFDAHLDPASPGGTRVRHVGDAVPADRRARAAAGLPVPLPVRRREPGREQWTRCSIAPGRSVSVVMDVDCGLQSTEDLRSFVAGCSAVYLTVCLDVLPALGRTRRERAGALGVPLGRVIELCSSGGRRVPGARRVRASWSPRMSPSCARPTTRAVARPPAARIVYEIAAFSR